MLVICEIQIRTVVFDIWIKCECWRQVSFILFSSVELQWCGIRRCRKRYYFIIKRSVFQKIIAGCVIRLLWIDFVIFTNGIRVGREISKWGRILISLKLTFIIRVKRHRLRFYYCIRNINFIVSNELINIFSNSTEIILTLKLSSKWLRESALLIFTFDDIYEVTNHFRLISQRRMQLLILVLFKAAFQQWNQMAWMIQCPVLVDPNPNLSQLIQSNQFRIYMKPANFLISCFESNCCLFEHFQTFRETQLRKLAQSLRDPFSINIQKNFLVAAIAQISQVLLFLSIFVDLQRFVTLYQAKLIIFSERVCSHLFLQAISSRQSYFASLCQFPICFVLVDFDTIVIFQPLPLWLILYRHCLIPHDMQNKIVNIQQDKNLEDPDRKK